MDLFIENVTQLTTPKPTASKQLADLELASVPIQLMLLVLYTMTAIVSFCGNILVLLVLFFGKKSHKELRKFLINLALSDIAMSMFSIPFTYTDFMLNRWIFAPVLCPLASFFTVCAMSVSIYTLIVIGLDRYFAVVKPLQPSTFINRHSGLALVLLWFVGISFSAPQLYSMDVEPFRYGNQSYLDCREDWGRYKSASEIYSIVLFFGTFLWPMVVLSVIYGIIGCKILRRMPVNDSDSTTGMTTVALRDRTDHRSRATVKAIKMMITVVVLFAICWTPIQLFNLIDYVFGHHIVTKKQWQMNIYVGCFFLCHFLAMGHSMVNPLIYGFMSESFKEDFKYICRRCWLSRLCRWRYSPGASSSDGDGFGGGSATRNNVKMKRFQPSVNSHVSATQLSSIQ